LRARSYSERAGKPVAAGGGEETMTTYTWNNSNGGDWGDSQDWTNILGGNGVPGVSDYADITASGTYTVTVSNGDGAAAYSLTVA
jgi:hypothetical protein